MKCFVFLFTVISVFCLFLNSIESNESHESKKGFLFDDEEELLTEGRKQYSNLLKNADIYGECWINALKSLDIACKELTEELQWRLALKFSNCFLAKSGFKTYECDEQTKIADCIRGIDDKSYNVLSLYFTHTQSVCFFLANKLWQQSTKQTISHLTDTVTSVGSQMQELESLQLSSLSNQKKLNEEIVESKTVIQSFKETVNEQLFLGNQILDRFLEAKDFILKETSKVYTVLFYIMSSFTVFLVTSPSRTKDARLGLLLLFIFNFILEIMIANHYLAYNLYPDMNSVSSLIDQRIWICRKISCLIAFLYLIYTIFAYKDYNKMNNKLLQRIFEQNKELSLQNKEILQQFQSNRTLDFGQRQIGNCIANDEDYIPDDSSETESSEDTGVDSDPEVSSTIDLCDSNEEIEQVIFPYNLRPRRTLQFKQIDESVEQFAAQFSPNKRIYIFD